MQTAGGIENHDIMTVFPCVPKTVFGDFDGVFNAVLFIDRNADLLTKCA